MLDFLIQVRDRFEVVKVLGKVVHNYLNMIFPLVKVNELFYAVLVDYPANLLLKLIQMFQQFLLLCERIAHHGFQLLV